MVKSLNRLYIVIFMILFLQPFVVRAETYNEPAQTGTLDLGQYDVPLNYVDKQPYENESCQTNQERFDFANEYLKAVKMQEDQRKKQALADIDQTLNDYNKVKKEFDQSRKSYNYDNYYYPPYSNQSEFTTEIRKRPNFFVPAKEYYNLGNYGYQPYMGIFNTPGYIGNVENYYDGIDNDTDRFIDEGFNKGNVQIVIGDSGINKDDEWALYVDNMSMGLNDYGMVRTWDLNLFTGTHKITIVAAIIPDGLGTYSISFQNASVVSGPPMVGGNIPQGESLQWVIKVK